MVKPSPQRGVAEEFSRALRRAQKAAIKGRPELAVEWCRYAATLGFGTNSGVFYSHELEQILTEIGRKYLEPGLPGAPPATPPQHFLHLMSTAYETGGHTRVVSRWIETCAQYAPLQRHSILISMQWDTSLPSWLGDSARKTGGELIELPTGLSWLQAAAEIRFRSLKFDAVILHIHPNDPLPNLAFHDHPRSVLFFRHADHVFNLGMDVARVVADIRPVGHEMSVRFGPQAPRRVMLPVPLLDIDSSRWNKADARRHLGLPVDALIVLTIGSPHKFVPIEGYSFVEVVRRLCWADPRVHIVAIGPSESEPFPGLRRSMEGRFMPVGTVEDPELLELFYCATDIYLDAYPTGSLTAVLDAARHALPVQRLNNRDRCLLWCDDPALDSVMLGASTQDEYIATVLEWLTWPEAKRSELGRRFRDAVLEEHCGASWTSKSLDPALMALTSHGEIGSDLVQNSSSNEELDFPGLGVAVPENDWPPDMFIAGTSISHQFVFIIRISGVFRSIKPLLFHAQGDGKTRRRFELFNWLVASCIPDRVWYVLRRIRRAIFKHLRRRRQSTD